MIFPNSGLGVSNSLLSTVLAPGVAAVVSGQAPAQAMQQAGCDPPPGFTWVAEANAYLPIVAGAPIVNGPCRWSPIAFPGLGIQIGPFTFPWTTDTMPGSVGCQCPGKEACDPTQLTYPPDCALCVGEHGDYNGINGKRCALWTTVITDWQQLPAGLSTLLQTILLSDVEGNGHGFGNYWFNKAWQPAADGTGGQSVTLSQYQQWMTALGIGPNQNYYLNFIPVEGNGLGFAENWYEGLPVVQFDHPNPALGRWGVWLALEHTGGFDSPFVLRVIVDNLTDAKGRLPVTSSFVRILNALNPLNWPGMFWKAVVAIGVGLGDLVTGLVDEFGALLCDLTANPAVVTAAVTAAATTQKIPPQQAAGIAATVNSISKAQCTPTPPNCADPKNATLTQCLIPLPPIAPVLPWWQQWYVIAGAALLVGLVLFSDNKSEKPAAAT